MNVTWKPIIKWHADVGLRIGPIDRDQSENLATVYFFSVITNHFVISKRISARRSCIYWNHVHLPH